MKKLIFITIMFQTLYCFCQTDNRTPEQIEDSLFAKYRPDNRTESLIKDSLYSVYLYQSAIKSAKDPLLKKIDNNLSAVSSGDSITVVAWKTSRILAIYRKHANSVNGEYNTGEFEIWVVPKKELIDRLKLEFSKGIKDTNLRIQQLLGLPPTKNEDRGFAEFKVGHDDLFRPCPDEEVDDHKCDPHFPQNGTLDHLYWMLKNREDRYFSSDPMQNYPWTQLGYTYDWNPEPLSKSHIGLSEFVVKDARNIILKGTYSTKAYLDQIH